MTATNPVDPDPDAGARIAAGLFHAQRAAAPIRQPSAAGATMTPAEGYGLQHRLLDLRLRDGERITGLKLGFTSRAKRDEVGVDEVICGRLTDRMEFADGDTADPATLIRPRVEPEVVFRLGRDVDPEESIARATGAIDAVAAGVEIVDSRYLDFRFDLADLLADNASAAGYVVGPWRRMPMDLGNRGVLLEIDGQPAGTGSTAAILGDPRRAITAATRLALSLGIALSAGQVILAGAATTAVPLRPGSVARAAIDGLGTVTLQMGTRPANAPADREPVR